MTALTTAPDVHFSPRDDQDSFKHALEQFTTGITVVTTDRGEGPVGIVANNFTSVSMDPPLILWCADKSSHRFEHFADARRFAVHVLKDDQRSIADALNRSKTAFDGFKWTASQSGVPLIHGCAACFECNLSTTQDAGDHAIVLGEVIRAHNNGGTPLVAHAGRYGGFAERII